MRRSPAPASPPSARNSLPIAHAVRSEPRTEYVRWLLDRAAVPALLISLLAAVAALVPARAGRPLWFAGHTGAGVCAALALGWAASRVRSANLAAALRGWSRAHWVWFVSNTLFVAVMLAGRPGLVLLPAAISLVAFITLARALLHLSAALRNERLRWTSAVDVAIFAAAIALWYSAVAILPASRVFLDLGNVLVYFGIAVGMAAVSGALLAVWVAGMPGSWRQELVWLSFGLMLFTLAFAWYGTAGATRALPPPLVSVGMLLPNAIVGWRACAIGYRARAGRLEQTAPGLLPQRAWLSTALAGAALISLLGLEQFLHRSGTTTPLASGVVGIVALMLGLFVVRTIFLLRHVSQTRSALRVSEARYSELVASSPDAIVAVDARGRVVLWNPAAERLFGYAASEIVGRPIDTVVPSQLRSATHSTRNASDADSQAAGPDVVCQAREATGLHRDGREIPIELSVSAAAGADGPLITAFIRDIAVRRQAREELVRRERLAALGQVAGSIAHDLRNPLGVIRNAAYYLRFRIGPELAGRAARHLGYIDEEVERSNRIITSLLDFARGRPYEPAHVPVSDLVGSAASRSRLPAGVRIETALPAGLPSVYVDSTQLTQVIVNLLFNASEAMAGSGTIRVTAAALDGRVRVTLTDTGPGIRPENLSRLFEPLFTTKTLGVGLGLSICRSFVEMNHGTITAESRPGQGATFHVTLPTAPGA